MPTRLLSLHLRRALIATLLVALAMTQALGVLHRALSGHVAVSERTTAAATAPESGSRLLQTLFGGHHDERDCKVFDQLAHADLADGKAAEPLAYLPADGSVPDIHPAWHIAAQAAGFLARGPPPRV